MIMRLSAKAMIKTLKWWNIKKYKKSLFKSKELEEESLIHD